MSPDEEMVVVCLRLADGPKLTHATAPCWRCRELVGVTAATLDAVRQQHPQSVSYQCLQCCLDRFEAGTLAGKVELLPLSEAQLAEVRELRRMKERDR